MTVAVRVQNLKKIYPTDEGDVNAVDDVSFEINSGEFFTLLGPSGCGKSTTLRCIAGLERADGGEITIGDTLVVSKQQGLFVPPHRRPIGMVFQSYAIWPHMNVFDNVAFPITHGSDRVPKSEVRSRVMTALDLVRLGGLENRPAPQLSGGQQQRLALARALVREPQVLLLDEPLSNLDAKLRDEMRVELKELTQRLRITTVFVTHDQLEALTLSDQIAVMRDGVIRQLGSSEEIYATPNSRFTAEFIGTTNLVEGEVTETSGNSMKVAAMNGELVCDAVDGFESGGKVIVAIRPEGLKVSLTEPAEAENTFSGTVEAVIYLGDSLDCRIRVGEDLLRAFVAPRPRIAPGDSVFISAAAADCRPLPLETSSIELDDTEAAAVPSQTSAGPAIIA